jgi:hypothetical protein
MKPLEIKSRALYRSLTFALLVDTCFLAFVYFLEAMQLEANQLHRLHPVHQTIDWTIFCGIQVILLFAFAWWQKKHALFHGTLLYLMIRLTWTLCLAILLWLNF